MQRLLVFLTVIYIYIYIFSTKIVVSIFVSEMDSAHTLIFLKN